MKVVIAIDSLKGSLSSMEAGMAIKDGVLAAKPDAEVIVKPLADGGEETAGEEGQRRGSCSKTRRGSYRKTTRRRRRRNN